MIMEDVFIETPVFLERARTRAAPMASLDRMTGKRVL
jgi:hypothetical protein